MAWAAAIPWIVSAIGGAASAYGSNRKAQATEDAQRQNAALQQQQNLEAYKNYLMTRGIDPTGVTETGQIPANPRAINTKLPLWARMQRPTGRTAAGHVVRRPGFTPGAQQSLIRRRSG